MGENLHLRRGSGVRTHRWTDDETSASTPSPLAPIPAPSRSPSNSSLAAAIGYPELMSAFGGTVLNQVGQAIEILTMVMLVYLVISLAISLLLNYVNKKMAIQGR